MKILLVKPNVHTDSITPPLGLGYLAASLSEEHEVSILDCSNRKISLRAFKRKLKELAPNLVGIQAYSMDKEVARDYLRTIREVNKEIWTVIGGPYPSTAPEEAFDFLSDAIDFAFVGEAEKGLAQLVDELPSRRNLLPEKSKLQKVGGLVWREGPYTRTNSRNFVQNLDELPAPRWDLFPPSSYPHAPHAAFMKKFPTAPIIVSRGCPFKCIFCAASHMSGRKMRYRSVEAVIEEIETLVHRFGVQEIHIVDDNFTFKRDYVYQFCETLIQKKLVLPWSCPNGVRLDTLDRDLLAKMREAGCYSISVGIESGSDRILKLIKKGTSVNLIRQKVRLIKEAGLKVNGFFIFGFPTESIEEINDTIRLSLELDLDVAQYMNFYPFPGTEAYEILRESDELNRINLNTRSFAGIAYTPSGLSKNQLKWLQFKAFILFYGRPKSLVDIFRQVHSKRHLWHIFLRGYRYLFTR